jgi:holo-[acyl-carrier protein] synthase
LNVKNASEKDSRQGTGITEQLRIFLQFSFELFIYFMMILGIGIDMTDKDRVARAVKRWGNRFLNRILTHAERELCDSKPDRIGSIAARFAAKEAVFKALGTGWSRGVQWRDIEILSALDGRPEVSLSGETGRRADGCKVWVSLSHGRTASVAMAVLERGERLT